jgi:hypothetical protein
MATTQIEAHLCFQAARAEGVWVIVGGAAWGATQQPARRLGASLMLTDVGELASDVREGCPAAEAIATAPLDDEAILQEPPPPSLMESALAH